MKRTEIYVQVLAESDNEDYERNDDYLVKRMKYSLSRATDMDAIVSVRDQHGKLLGQDVVGQPSEKLREMSWK